MKSPILSSTTFIFQRKYLRKMSITTVRPAVCIKHSDAMREIGMWKPFIMDRSICDDPQNVDPSNLQLLPYVSLLAMEPGANGKPEAHALRYIRGKAGAESRLHNLYSIGFGGHVDAWDETRSLAEQLTDETIREVYEELGITLDRDEVLRAVQAALEFRDFIYLPETPVGSVHLGISINIFVDKSEFHSDKLVEEVGQVEQIKWENISKFTEEDIAQYEPWSQRVIRDVLDAQEELKSQMAQWTMPVGNDIDHATE